jgi:hypothetical protein
MSQLNENPKDRSNEEEMLWMYEQHLLRLGIKNITPYPSDTPEHFDYDIFINDVHTTVLEVRKRQYDSEEVEKWGTLVINKPKLVGLRKLFYIDGVWTKEIVFMNVTTDGWAYATNMKTVLRQWKNCPPARPHQMKTDHGKNESGRQGVQIPICYMEKFR